MYISILRIFIASLMLGYASYKDLKTREVSDAVWLFFGFLGVIVNILELFFGYLNLSHIMIPVGFTLIFTVFSWFLGLLGEADLLAMFTLTIIQPLPIFYSQYPFWFPPILFPFTVLSNSVLIGASFSILILIANLLKSKGPLFDGYDHETYWKKAILLLTSRKIQMKEVRGPPYQYPRESVNGITKKIDLGIRIQDDETASRVFDELRSMGVKAVWVSYTLPFIAVMLAGYIISLIFGDVLFSFFTYLF